MNTRIQSTITDDVDDNCDCESPEMSTSLGADVPTCLKCELPSSN